MTTPVPTAALTLTTDQPSYPAGAVMTVTAVYSDPSQATTTDTITGSAVDANGVTVTATATVSVFTPTDLPMTVSVSDTFNDVFSQTSDDGVSTVVFTATVTPPAA
jgi:hypothetical protein